MPGLLRIHIIVLTIILLHGTRQIKGHLVQLWLRLDADSAYNSRSINGHGNYCGLGGSGTPLNSIDSCCQSHDLCYDKHDECDPKTTWYKYDKHSCHKTILWFIPLSNCRYEVCQCDHEFIKCLNDTDRILRVYHARKMKTRKERRSRFVYSKLTRDPENHW